MKRFWIPFLCCLLIAPAWAQSPVKVWQDKLTLPSYRVDKPDPNPMFPNSSKV